MKELEGDQVPGISKSTDDRFCWCRISEKRETRVCMNREKSQSCKARDFNEVYRLVISKMKARFEAYLVLQEESAR